MKKNILLRSHLKSLLPYEPGKPIEEVKRKLKLKDVYKLASNENPFGPSKLAVRAIKKNLSNLNLYPDGTGYYLKKALAKKLNVRENNLILGNGSDEIVNLLALTFLNPNDEVIIAVNAFIRYQMAVHIVKGKNIFVPMKDHTHDLKAMTDRITSKTKMIFVANPNNPTGTMVTKSEVSKFIKRVPKNIIIVFDEAYYEFITRKDYPKTIPYVREGRNIIILRTFSKMYGLAGLRIGYGIARPDIIYDLNRVRCPFNANSLAQAAALASLKDTKHITKTRNNNSREKKYLYKELKNIGLFFVPTEANFILIKTGNKTGEICKKLLMDGIIVRSMAGYRMPDFLRITIGKPKANRKFIASLGKIL